MSSEVPNNPIDHATFREQIAAALAGGLSAAEQSAFDAHAAACAACASELDAARKAEERMTALFASSAPIPGFEDRIIQSLRLRRGSNFNWRPNWTNWRIHPAVSKAAIGVAAVIVLGGFGYVATHVLDDGSANRIKAASNLRQIGSAALTKDRYTDFYLGGKVATTNGRDAKLGAAGDRWKFKGPHGDDFGLNADANAAAPAAPAAPGFRFSDSSSSRGGTVAYGSFSPPTVSGGSLVLNGGAVQDEARLSQISGSTNRGESYGDAHGAVATGSLGIGAGDRSVRTTNLFYADLSGKSPTNAPADQGQKTTEVWFKPMELAKAGERNWSVEAKLSEQDYEKVQAGRDVRLSDSDADGKKAPAAPAQVAQVTEMPALISPPIAAEPAAPGSPAPAPAPAAPDQPPQPTPSTRKIIRNGQLEFEVDRFDSAFAQVSKLTTEAGGYVGTTDSEKLPNGKVKGTVTVRVPPDRLDTLVLQLRGIGDLKSQKLEAQDISKHYSDMDSELRAAKAMEERLLAIIKEGKGQIKDLLAAEKELGNWRTKIEQLIGEMKYYDNLVALSTLNITLYERDIKTPATAYENETIDSGVETEDVEKARADALKAIEEAKGRVIQSDLKRFDAGQFAATIIADVPADNAGPMLDRLKQLGKMARLDVQRKQTVADNAATAAGGAPVRVEKRDTRLNLSLYNLANVAPRQMITLNIAADDVEAAYRAILARVTKAGGRVITSNLARNKPEATTGTISFEVPSVEADAVKADVQAGGETMKLAVNDNPDVQNSTAAKRGFSVSLTSAASIAPRETATLQVAAVDVVAARDRILQASTSAGAGTGGARVLATQLNANDSQNVSATIDLDVHRGEPLAKVEKAIADAGQTISRLVQRSTDTENTLDSKVHLSLTLGPAEKLPPREMTTLSVELSDVESAMGDLAATAQSLGGRTVESNLSKSRDGQSTSHVVVEVPLDKAGEMIKHAKDLGAVRSIDSGKNLQVPAGPLAKARIDVTFGNAEAIVSPDKGFWASIRRGLSTSVAGLMWSLQLIVIGLCFVLPWVALIFVAWRFYRGRRRAVAAVS